MMGSSREKRNGCKEKPEELGECEDDPEEGCLALWQEQCDQCGKNNVKLIKKLGWQENGFQLPAVILKLKEKVATKSGVLQQPALP